MQEIAHYTPGWSTKRDQKCHHVFGSKVLRTKGRHWTRTFLGWLFHFVLYQMHNTILTTLCSIFSFWGFLGGLFTLQVIREQIWKCGYSFYWKEQLSKYLTNWLHFQVITVVLLFKNSIYFFYFQLVLFYISNKTIVNTIT